MHQCANRCFRRVNLDAVATSFHGIPARLCILFLCVLDFLERHRPGRRMRLHAHGIGEHLAGQFDFGRSQDPGSVGQVSLMDHAATMHQLDENSATFVMDRISHLPPTIDLLRTVNPRDPWITDSVRGR